MTPGEESCVAGTTGAGKCSVGAQRNHIAHLGGNSGCWPSEFCRPRLKVPKLAGEVFGQVVELQRCGHEILPPPKCAMSHCAPWNVRAANSFIRPLDHAQPRNLRG